MAKKNRKKNSVTGQSSIHPDQMIYALLNMMGVAETIQDIVPNYEEKGHHVSIAIPRINFCLAFISDNPLYSNDDSEYFSENGWTVETINPKDLEAFSRIFTSVMSGRIAEAKMKMDPNIKNTSEPEEKLLNAILWRGLPTPDRNRKFFREDGTELTTPDFTWEEYKIAFYLDGAYWHSIKDDAEIIKNLKSNAKHKNEILAKRSDKVIKDNDNRSELTVMGYAVLVCSDADVETQEGIDRQVDRIEKLINNTKAAQELLQMQDDDNKEIIDNPNEENHVIENSINDEQQSIDKKEEEINEGYSDIDEDSMTNEDYLNAILGDKIKEE